MEEWVVAGLLGAVAGYGVRVWQEKTPAVVKRPAEAVVRTIGSAVGAGASMGGRAAGAGATSGRRRPRHHDESPGVRWGPRGQAVQDATRKGPFAYGWRHLQADAADQPPVEEPAVLKPGAPNRPI